ncbi:MAG: hypothetical protein ACP5O0_04700 [Acidimicrobiales bacterium]
MQEATIEITFYFDPACPWTWLTSRWLVEAASVRSLSVKWAPLSLFLLNNGDVPESFRIPLAQSFKALRAIAQLASQDHIQEIARFYTTIGTSYHYNQVVPSDEDLARALEDAGAESAVGALHDESFDELVQHYHNIGLSLSGPSTGSPVLQLSSTIGVFGPIVTEHVRGEEAGELFDHVRSLALNPRFSELKRGRTGPPVLS